LAIDFKPEEHAMSFGLYLTGYIVMIIGLGYGAYLAHVPQQWIAVLVLVLVGLGILTAVTRTRQKDPD
jgi:putative Mn2+ efflux pump MntP